MRWEIPRTAPRGTYRLLVTGKRYQLASNRFRVFGSSALKVTRVDAPAGQVHGGAGLPGGRARRGPDLPAPLRRRRPGALQGRLEDGDREAQARHLLQVKAAAGTPVTVAPLAARDRHNNANGAGVQFSLSEALRKTAEPRRTPPAVRAKRADS